jgi:hypothetical protein
MTLEAVFNDLSRKWDRLAEELDDGLLWAITQTKPEEEHELATQYLDMTTDLISTAREGLEAARAPSSNGTFNTGLATQSLLRCHERYNALADLFNSRMASYARLRHLRRFGRQRGRAWRDWAAHVRKGLEHCRGPMDDLNRALFDCWQEIAERADLTTISLRFTTVGQQIIVPEAGKRSDRVPAGSE